MLWDKPVGKVEVRREGLYYHFYCRCQVEIDTVCRVMADKENLGVLIPVGNGFGLETRIPAKRFGENVPEFRLVPNRPVLEGKFIPIKPEEPFAYIARLKQAYLTRQNGEMGITVQEAGT